MTADEFLVWAMDQPGRHELADGEVVAMAPERVAHAEAKAAIWLAMRNAIRSAGLRCQALPDGVSLRVDEATVFEPDASLRCGDPLPKDAIEFSDPVVVVEVLSQSTRAYDLGGKLEAYFRLASVRHYLIVKTDTRTIIHHARAEDGSISTRIVSEGSLTLDPPGIAFPTAEVFPGD
ncbi:MAG: Uma2 family endonuclease [Pseudomonadota bacterium]